MIHQGLPTKKTDNQNKSQVVYNLSSFIQPFTRNKQGYNNRLLDGSVSVKKSSKRVIIHICRKCVVLALNNRVHSSFSTPSKSQKLKYPQEPKQHPDFIILIGCGSRIVMFQETIISFKAKRKQIEQGVLSTKIFETRQTFDSEADKIIFQENSFLHPLQFQPTLDPFFIVHFMNSILPSDTNTPVTGQHRTSMVSPCYLVSEKQTQKQLRQVSFIRGYEQKRSTIKLNFIHPLQLQHKFVRKNFFN